MSHSCRPSDPPARTFPESRARDFAGTPPSGPTAKTGGRMNSRLPVFVFPGSGVVDFLDRGDLVVAVHADLREHRAAVLQVLEQPVLAARPVAVALGVDGDRFAGAQGRRAEHLAALLQRKPVGLAVDRHVLAVVRTAVLAGD